MSFSSSTAYTCEVYPTALRDMAVGFYNGLGRIMALFSTFIFFGLGNIRPFSPYVFSLIMIVMSLISAVILPFETRGKGLDTF